MRDNKNKVTGYMVCYSEGSYDTFFVHNVGVYLKEEDALKRCREIDDEHFNNKSEIDEETWNDIYYEYCDLVDKDPEFITKIPYDKPGGKKEHERVLKYQEDKFIDTIQKYYPEWSREKCKKEKEIMETIEDCSMKEVGEAFIEEIDVYL